MSSNDRRFRSNQQRSVPEPEYDASYYDEAEWDVDADFEDPTQPRQTPARGQNRPANTETNASSGTRAQLDQLRRNIRQNAGQSRSQQRPAPRSTQQTGRYTPPITDDVIYEDPYYQDSAPASMQSPGRPAPPRIRRGVDPSTSQRQVEPQRQSTYAPESYATDAYADDLYDDSPAFEEYEDDFSEYDAPRRPARTPRQAPQMRMPNISRPSLPPAIANADLVNDAPSLGIIGAGLLSLAAMAILVANQVDSLAPQFATHVSASGVLESFKGEGALWNIPLMAGMFLLMNIVMAWFISPIDRFASRFVLVGGLIVQFVAWVAIFRIL